MDKAEPESAGDPIPAQCSIIEVHVPELRRLFNAIDPSPFHERDLDPDAEEFVVGWAKELPREKPLALRVHLDRAAGPPEEVAVLRDAVHEFFNRRALAYRRRLRLLFRMGRTSLLIGLAFLAGSFALGDLIVMWMRHSPLAELAREGVTIGGWVAMWRPLEVFLYDWWPLRAEARLSDRLAAMPIEVRYGTSARQSWRHDWPADTPERRS